MPKYRVTPAVEAISVQGVEFRADAEGFFRLPSNPVIHAMLADHGLTLDEIEALDDEPGFRDSDTIIRERDEQIAALQAELAALRAKPLEEPGVATAPAEPAKLRKGKPAPADGGE